MEIAGVIWGIMALVLIGPAAIATIRGNPTGALRNIAFWLGLVVLAAFLYRHGGLEEWWTEKHRYAPQSIQAQ